MRPQWAYGDGDRRGADGLTSPSPAAHNEAARPGGEVPWHRERSVYEVGPVFRAEPHDTVRHLAQYTSLDAERFVARLVGVDNVREATLFPRDRQRLTP